MIKDGLVFLDIETTGLNFRMDRILEVGIVAEKGGKQVKKRFLINPGIPIKKRAYAVHGISFEDVKGEPAFEEVKDEILKLINGSVIVGFNILNLDIPFINFELMRIGEKPIINRVIDLKEVSKFIFENPPNSLFALSRRFGIGVKRIHRALEDADTTRKIFERMVHTYASTLNNISVLESLSLSTYPSKSLEIMEITREYGSVRLRYLTRFSGIKEWEIVPFVILKNLIVAENEKGNILNLYVPRIINVQPPL